MSLTILRDGASAVVIDDGARRVVITSWFGEPTVSCVDQYFDWHSAYLDGARKERARFVTITDTFGATRPSPSARKRIAERMETLGSDVQELTIASYVIVESALLRGAITALAWLHAPLAETIAVASPKIAIESALRDLDAAGIARPPNLSATGYRRPARP